MHMCFLKYIFRINAIMVNEGKVGTSCRAKDVSECKIRKASALDSFKREPLMWVWTVTTTNTFSLTELMTQDLFQAINRLQSSTNTFIFHFTSFLPFSSNVFSFLGVSVVSWSLLIVHMNPAIALQLVWGSYNGQQKLLTSKKDTKKHITSGPNLIVQISLTIWSGLYNLNQRYF